VLLFWLTDLSAFTTHLMAYAFVLPFSFLGHRRITFSYKGPGLWAFIRFSLTSVFALSVSSWLVWYLQATGSPAVWGIVATMVIVPMVSYLVMSIWVFPERAQHGKHP
jgi:putative flippase GtrA